MQFQDDLAGGIVLVRPALRSPNYVSGSAGWNIGVDGSAEFNSVTIRGATVAGGQALYYNGTPASGNLIVSISGAAGTDAYGNAYVRGVGAYGAAGQVVARDTAGDTATLAGTIPTSGTLASMPGLAMQPKFNSGDPASIGALDDGSHTNFSLLLTSPSAVAGGIPGTDYSQINMIGRYSGLPCEVDVDAATINLNGDTAVAGLFTAGSRVVGSVTITPSAANTPTSATVTFPQLSGSSFRAQVSAITTVPGTQVTGVGASSVTSTSAIIWLTRSNTTATRVDYVIEGV